MSQFESKYLGYFPPNAILENTEPLVLEWASYRYFIECFDQGLPGAWSDHKRNGQKRWVVDPAFRIQNQRRAKLLYDRMHERIEMQHMNPDSAATIKREISHYRTEDCYDLLVSCGLIEEEEDGSEEEETLPILQTMI